MRETAEMKLVKKALECFVWQKEDNIKLVDIENKKVFFVDGDIFVEV